MFDITVDGVIIAVKQRFVDVYMNVNEDYLLRQTDLSVAGQNVTELMYIISKIQRIDPIASCSSIDILPTVIEPVVATTRLIGYNFQV